MTNLRRVACNPNLSKKLRLRIISRRFLEELRADLLTIKDRFQIVTFNVGADYKYDPNGEGNVRSYQPTHMSVFRFKYELEGEREAEAEAEIYNRLEHSLDGDIGRSDWSRVSNFKEYKTYKTLTIRDFIWFSFLCGIYYLIAYSSIFFAVPMVDKFLPRDISIIGLLVILAIWVCGVGIAIVTTVFCYYKLRSRWIPYFRAMFCKYLKTISKFSRLYLAIVAT